MPGLLRDRYFEYLPDQAWDLVTGEVVSAGSARDEEGDVRSPEGALSELLEHGVEGTPRWVVTTARPTDWLTETRAIAAEARHRGYVAVSVDVLLRARLLLGGELQTRAMVLI